MATDRNEFRLRHIREAMADFEDPKFMFLDIISPTRHLSKHNRRESNIASAQVEDDSHTLERLTRVHKGEHLGGGTSGIKPWEHTVLIPHSQVDKFIKDLRSNHPDWGASTPTRIANVDINDPNVWPWHMYERKTLLKPRKTFNQYEEEGEEPQYYNPETDELEDMSPGDEPAPSPTPNNDNWKAKRKR